MSRKETISLIILLIVISVGAYKYFNRSFSATKTRFQLDTFVEISATSQSKNIGKQIDDVFEFIKTLESKLDEYDDNSWISRLNNSTTTINEMDPDAYEILLIADSLFHFSNGHFDPTIKPVFDLWGFGSKAPSLDDSLRLALPDSSMIQEKMKLVGFEKIRFDKKHIYKPIGMQLSFGAIAKGYILDKAKEYMISRKLIRGYISCRSSIVMFGNNIPQVIMIQHPRKPNEEIASFKILNNSIGTSGDYQQSYEVDGVLYHHLLDAKTGYPVRHTYSVTIVNPSAAWADGLSTALFVMDPSTALQKIKSIVNTNAVIYCDQNNSIVSMKTVGMQKLDLKEKL